MRGPCQKEDRGAELGASWCVGLAARHKVVHAGDGGHPAGREASSYVEQDGQGTGAGEQQGPRGVQGAWAGGCPGRPGWAQG